MRIKRFIAPDMRTALRMVRDEQGPDAVILSNRPTEDGIEIVSATDYDESLAQQALRAALPSLPPTPAPVASPSTPATVAAVPPMTKAMNEVSPPLHAGEGWGGLAKPRSGELEVAAHRGERHGAQASLLTPSREGEEQKNSRMASLAALLTRPAKGKPAWTAPDVESTRVEAERVEIEHEEPAVVALSEQARAKIAESPIRGRAVFSLGDGTPVVTTPRASKAETRIAAPLPAPDTSRFDAMMAALIPQGGKFEAAAHAIAETITPNENALGHEGSTQDVDASAPAEAHAYRSLADLWVDEPAATAASLPSPAVRGIEGEGRNQDGVDDRTAGESSPSFIDLSSNHFVAPHPTSSPAAQTPAAATPHLHAVADPRDPGMLAMRDELSTMRQMIERELAQMSVERLRGSPARAAAYDALMRYGCDESLAQTIAGRIDARLDPAQVHEPMLAELARALSVLNHEPIDDGGVIALVGPTGAGKTTTAAKLAARFAQRHRARDVALVTTDTERPGATEQLHILGRRLGVTVCEANGPEALNDALDQLADYPLVLVDTAGHGLRDRALLGQILWLRAARRVRSLLVLPANTNAHDLGEVVRRYRPASPEGVVLTKLDETGRLGSALSVMVQHGLSLAYTTDGQQVPTDLAAADARRLVMTLEKVRRAADNPLGSLDSRPMTLPTEDRHAIAS